MPHKGLNCRSERSPLTIVRRVRCSGILPVEQWPKWMLFCSRVAFRYADGVGSPPLEGPSIVIWPSVARAPTILVRCIQGLPTRSTSAQLWRGSAPTHCPKLSIHLLLAGATASDAAFNRCPDFVRMETQLVCLYSRI
jgi:hypothetical protein